MEKIKLANNIVTQARMDDHKATHVLLTVAEWEMMKIEIYNFLENGTIENKNWLKSAIMRFFRMKYEGKKG